MKIKKPNIFDPPTNLTIKEVVSVFYIAVPKKTEE